MSAEDAAAEELLTAAGQTHLLEGLDGDGRARLFEQVQRLDAAYRGGLRGYVENARHLLQASQRGDNPFDGYTPSVPEGERVVYGDARFVELEARGVLEAKSAVFVLVAGGLGERLGFSGIKLALPTTVVTGWTYLEHYCMGIRALQSQPPGEPATIPLIIMTSDDTHAKTVRMMEERQFFGLKKEQVHILKQEKVACLTDVDARLGRDPKDPCQIETKPHGHGDVHALLHTTGLARRFHEEGKRWVVLFQDTNGLFFKAVLATLGVSAQTGMAMNTVAVPRRPKDALGGIARLTHSDGSGITVNVEYNQLDPLLRSTIMPDGDTADSTGWSPFPGNMNSLVLSMDTYLATLERTEGVIAEFVNPKYADSTKTKFKSSTRLECMMQDIPKEFPAKAKVGFTMFEQWCSLSPVKNDAKAARQKFESGTHPASATTGETDLFAANCRILRMAGAQVEPAKKVSFNGIEVDLEARVVWSPQWACTYQAVKERLSPGSVLRISQRSTLVLDGDIMIEDLTLDGALVVSAELGSRVRIKQLMVSNEGWVLEPIQDVEDDEVAKIRGFKLKRAAARVIKPVGPGELVVDEGRS